MSPYHRKDSASVSERMPPTPVQRPLLQATTPSTTSTLGPRTPDEYDFDRPHRGPSEVRSPYTPFSDDDSPFFESFSETEIEPTETSTTLSFRAPGDNRFSRALEASNCESPYNPSARRNGRRKSRHGRGLYPPDYYPQSLAFSAPIDERLDNGDRARRGVPGADTSTDSEFHWTRDEIDAGETTGDEVRRATSSPPPTHEQRSGIEAKILDMEPYFEGPPDRRTMNNILRRLLALRNTKKLRQEHGYIYIFKAEEVLSHVKIGRTRENPPTRLEQWRKSCRMAILEVPDDFRDAFEGYRFVEKLVHAELILHRYKIKCEYCKRNGDQNEARHHNEWFNIECTHALKAVKRWREWVLKKPYTSDGELTAFWSWRVRKLPSHINTVDWEVWTKPSFSTHWDFHMETWMGQYYLAFRAHQARKDWKFALVGCFQLWVSSVHFGLGTMFMNIIFLIAL